MVAMVVEKRTQVEKMKKKKKGAKVEEGPLPVCSGVPASAGGPGASDKGGMKVLVAGSSGLVGGKELSDPVDQPSQKSKKGKKKRVRPGVASDVEPSNAAAGQSEKAKTKRNKISKGEDTAGTAGEVDVPSRNGGVEVLRAPEPVGMQIYWNLSSLDATVREGASFALVREVLGAQRDYEDRGLGQEEKAAEAVILGEAKTEEDGLKHCAPAVQYAIRRLVRGVASSRESARQGFALAFASVLGALPCIPGDAVVKMIERHLEVASSMKGQEARDALLGQLFAYGALIRSSQALWAPELANEIAHRLVRLGKKKNFLREPATYLLVELVEKLEDSGLQKGVCASPLFVDVLTEELDSNSPDTFFLALKFRQKLPTSSFGSGSYIPDSGKLTDIFERGQLLRLVPCLKESSYCHPRVHSVWDPLLLILFSESGHIRPSKSNKRRSPENESTLEMRLMLFWSVVVEESLLTSSHERKHLAMQLLLFCLPKLPSPSYINCILSQKFVQCLLDASASKENLLYKSAKNCITEVCEWAEGDEERRIKVVIALQQSSQGKFDHLSKTQSIKGLLSRLTTLTGYQVSFQALSSLYLSARTPEGETLVDSSLKSKKPKSPAGDLEAGGSKDTRADTGSGLQRWAVDLLRGLCQQALVGLPANVAVEQLIAKFVPSLAPLQPFTDDEEESVSNLQSTMLQVSTALSHVKSGEKKDRLRSMLSLLVQLLLESRLVPSVVSGTASEITICCKKAFGDLVELEVELDTEDDNSPAFMDILVDVLLSLLAQPSAPIRAAADQVFKSFSGDLTSTGLTDLLRIVKKNTQRSRHRPVVEVDTQDEDDEDILDIEETAEESGEEDEDDRGSNHGEELDGSDEDNVELSAVREEVNMSSKPGAPEDEDDDKESEASDLDDETMFRMDKHLGMILKQRQQGGGSGTEDSKDAQTQLIHFKFRVLALLEFFLQRHSGSMLVLTMLPSLLHVFVNSCTTDGNSQLADRVSSILLNKLFKGKQYPRGPDVDHSRLKDLLKKALTLASRSTVKRVAVMAQGTCHWILKVLNGNMEQEEDKDVEEMFSAALEDFFVHKKCRLPLAFFKECCIRNPWLGKFLFGALLEKCLTARSEFLQFESLQLVGTILGFKGGKFSTKSKQQSLDLLLQPRANSLQPYLSSLSNLIVHLWKVAPQAKACHRTDALQFCVSVLELHQTLYPDKPLAEFVDYDDLAVALGKITASSKSRLRSLIVKLQELEGKSRK